MKKKKKEISPSERRRREAQSAKSRGVPAVRSDTEALSNTAWDDVSRVYLECHALSVLPSQTLPLLRDGEKLQFVKDVDGLSADATRLSVEAANFATRLEQIHLKHVDFTGGEDDPDKFMLAITIGEEYQQWMMGYQMEVIPLINKVTGYFEEAIKHEQAEKAASK